MGSKSKLDKIFFYSDPHFFHKNVLGFNPERGYTTVDGMVEGFIEKYNSVVPEDGLVYWVGDCFWCGTNKAKEVMDRLNGTKALIRGNHDDSHGRMYNVGFSVVVDYIELMIAGEMVKIKHYPGKYSNNPIKNWFKFELPKTKFWRFIKRRYTKVYKPRYFDRYPNPDGRWLIHGHTHSNSQVDPKLKFIHVGVDAWNGYPVPYRTIERIIQKKGIKWT